VQERFGNKLALNELELSAEPGVILAVLGSNGAGKTTFVRCIATLIKPDACTLRVFGHDVVREPHAVRSSIGLAGQFAAVEPAMTGRVSSAYVPVSSMPSGLRAIAAQQPVTYMIGAVRSLTGGVRAEMLLGHPASYFVVRSLVWSAVILLVFGSIGVARYRRG
jgi:ABC-type molybdenum transport system ATPase subunit/photorepair protein PhrA